MCPGIGSRTFKALLAKFGLPQSVFEASIEELIKIPRITEKIAKQVLSVSIDKVEQEILALENEFIQVMTQIDHDFPANLKKAFDAPSILFTRGQFDSQDEDAVAIIGSREASREGLDIAKNIAIEFAKNEWTVVSGLARVIDTAAHQGAILPHGRTIGVLGSGIRNIHPKRSLKLAQEISKLGVLISEQHPDAPPQGLYLMARDRIVSGLSRALIVVEAGEQSGSMDTAKKARKQNRPVFAVDSGSPGTNTLLESGAFAISSTSFDVQEIIEQINLNLRFELTPQMEMF